MRMLAWSAARFQSKIFFEPVTFRVRDGSDCRTSPFVLVRPDRLDQQAVVEPVVLRLTADNRRINLMPTEGLNIVYRNGGVHT